MLATLVCVGLVLGVAAGIYVVRSRPFHRQRFYYFRCADCGQKLRYLASKAGRGGMCPLCRRRFTLPRRPEAVPALLDRSGGYQVRFGQRGLAVLAARRTASASTRP
jgi:DNA-directed RNA polymerase subunit RPC12/RpoP